MVLTIPIKVSQGTPTASAFGMAHAPASPLVNREAPSHVQEGQFKLSGAAPTPTNVCVSHKGEKLQLPAALPRACGKILVFIPVNSVSGVTNW